MFKFLVLSSALLSSSLSQAFCGFYVAKADTKLFNQASQVVLVRDAERTVLTMVNDFKGDPQEFAIVIPVPVVLEEGQINIGDKALVDHLDAYTAPRLVEYFDENPCRRYEMNDMVRAAPVAESAPAGAKGREKSLGVTIEASYTIGEYDILILSAQESDGLATWLTENGYQIPAGAEAVLGSYIKQDLKFFVAKVNLQAQSQLGFSYLRPIQVAYESAKFMLPIRLGTVNADGAQDLFIYTLTRNGRVETTNYRTVKLPTGMDIPAYVKDQFSDFYRDMFSTQVAKEDMRVVFMEYAWDMNWCDPCAADPLSDSELQSLGVFWLNQASISKPDSWRSPARDVFVTRLHVRYTAEKFPEDLIFQETSDRTNFQGRYVLRHPWTGDEQCAAATQYRRNLVTRLDDEAKALANLTGWDLNNIRGNMKLQAFSDAPPKAPRWWENLW